MQFWSTILQPKALPDKKKAYPVIISLNRLYDSGKKKQLKIAYLTRSIFQNTFHTYIYWLGLYRNTWWFWAILCWVLIWRILKNKYKKNKILYSVLVSVILKQKDYFNKPSICSVWMLAGLVNLPLSKRRSPQALQTTFWGFSWNKALGATSKGKKKRLIKFKEISLPLQS